MDSTNNIHLGGSVSNTGSTASFFQKNQSTIVVVALAIIAVIATLAALEVQYGILTATAAFAITHPITTIVIVLALVVAIGITIYVCRQLKDKKPRERLDTLDNANQEPQIHNTESTPTTLYTNQQEPDAEQSTLTQQTNQRDEINIGNGAVLTQTPTPPITVTTTNVTTNQNRPTSSVGISRFFSDLFSDEPSVRDLHKLLWDDAVQHDEQTYVRTLNQADQNINKVEEHIQNFNRLYDPMDENTRTSHHDKEFWPDYTGPQTFLKDLNRIFPSTESETDIDAFRSKFEDETKRVKYIFIFTEWSRLTERELVDLNWLIANSSKKTEKIPPFLPDAPSNKGYKAAGTLSSDSTYEQFWQLKIGTCNEYQTKIQALRMAIEGLTG